MGEHEIERRWGRMSSKGWGIGDTHADGGRLCQQIRRDRQAWEIEPFQAVTYICSIFQPFLSPLISHPIPSQFRFAQFPDKISRSWRHGRPQNRFHIIPAQPTNVHPSSYTTTKLYRRYKSVQRTRRACSSISQLCTSPAFRLPSGFGALLSHMYPMTWTKGLCISYI